MLFMVPFFLAYFKFYLSTIFSSKCMDYDNRYNYLYWHAQFKGFWTMVVTLFMLLRIYTFISYPM